MLNYLKTIKNIKSDKGFSLVELILVITIMTIITTVVLVRQATFSGSVSLESLAYEVALTVRQAQFFGVNVREVNIGGFKTFESGYGVFFDKLNPTSFVLFADLNSNYTYDGTSELVEIYNMTRGNYIKYLCVDSQCSDPSSSTFDKLYLTFRRPNPESVIRTDNVANCGTIVRTGCGLAKIYITSPAENVRDKIVIIRSTGQVSIETL